MTILDRFIAVRFFANFVLLFALLFLFGVSIDVILQLDRYSDAAAATGATGIAYWWQLGHAVLDFHGPRLFQFYAYLLGLVSVGAAGFTLAQMAKARELVAIMASGTSLVRVALVFVAAATGLNVLQLVNQELMLPRLAPLLVRDHQEIFKSGSGKFKVPLTRDGRGDLLRARWFDPATEELTGFLFIERDGSGSQVARVDATKAVWDAKSGRYQLTDGQRYVRTIAEGAVGTGSAIEQVSGGIEEVTPIESVATDLSPRVLTIRRYEQFAQMLSLRQIRAMREEGGVDPALLSRLTYLRLGGIAVNLLVLVASLPFFLLREPANLLRQSIACSLFAVPATLGSFVAMTVAIPGLAPAVAVFLPAAVLLPIALARMGTVKT